MGFLFELFSEVSDVAHGPLVIVVVRFNNIKFDFSKYKVQLQKLPDM